MPRWRRVAPNWTYIAGTGLFVVIGSVLLLTLVLLGAALRTGTWYVTVFVLVWTLGSARLNRMGLFMGADGVRLRTFFRTRTLPWRRIAMFEDRPAAMGLGWFDQILANLLGARAIWIVLENGTELQTQLTYSKPSDSADGADGGGNILRQVMSGAMGARLVRSMMRTGEDMGMTGSE